MTDPERPNAAFISRYPTEKDLEEALGPPRETTASEPYRVYPRTIFQSEDRPITGWPVKTTTLLATGQGELCLETSLQTGEGDTVRLRQEVQRCDALELIEALATWVASPESILRESSDGTLLGPEGPEETGTGETAVRFGEWR